MTVAQLIKELEKYPDNMDVFIDTRKTEFTYGLLNSVRTDIVTFIEDMEDEWGQDEAPTVTCVILDEE